MKFKLAIIGIFVLVVSTGALASTETASAQDHSGDFFTDDFFNDNFFDDEEDDSSEEDSFFQGSFFDDPFFTDEDGDTEDGDQENSTERPGCQPGEVHIPEDQDCDGEIDDRFRNNDTENESDTEPGEENQTDIEERHVTPAPEPSATGEDWISYPNPRDHYKHDQGIHREGSIKVCKILLNQNGEPITGTSIPGTTFEIDTNITYEDARPVTFTTELDQVADLMGTSPDLVEGDGYLEAECAEFHDLELNETYTYGQETITGEHSDKVEIVGYEEYWERGQEQPYTESNEYGETEESDGKVRLTPGDDNRHAEIIVINQITG